MKQLLAWIAALFGGGKKKKPPPVIVVPPPTPEKPPPPPPSPIKDRRPIGMIMIAEWVEPYIPDNRRWKLLGQYQFSYEALMAHGRECVKNMTYLDAQAMILWNKEGEEYWKPVSYIGDPRIFIPEIEPFIDDFFALFKGFKTGVCLRPDIYYEPTHYVTADPFADLAAKARYCIDRWGCSVFYVDSNKAAQPYTDNTLGHGGPMPVSVFADLHKQFPGCLFIPEHHTPEYYPYCAPYWMHQWGKPPENAVSVINCGGAVSIDRGDNILMGRVWYAAPELPLIKAAYLP